MKVMLRKGNFMILAMSPPTQGYCSLRGNMGTGKYMSPTHKGIAVRLHLPGAEHMKSYDFGHALHEGIELKFILQCEQRFPLFPTDHLFPAHRVFLRGILEKPAQ